MNRILSCSILSLICGILPFSWLSASPTDRALQLAFQTEQAYLQREIAIQTINTDSLFLHFAQEPEKYDADYYLILNINGIGRQATQQSIDALDAIGRQYHNVEMQLDAQLLEIEISIRPFHPTDSSTAIYVNKVERILKKAEKKGLMSIQLRALEYLSNFFWEKELYNKYFDYSARLADMLTTIRPDDYPFYRAAYAALGANHYKFGNYDKAVFYLKQSLVAVDRPAYFFETNLFNAMNALGMYYAERGETALADSFYMAMLQSPDIVRMRPSFDAIALGNLGHLRIRQGDYDRAIPLLTQSTKKMIARDDYSFATGTATGLADCYLQLGKMAECKQAIDSALVYLQNSRWDIDYRKSKLYPLMSRYYMKTNNADQAIRYLDSAKVAEERYRSSRDLIYVLQGEQLMHEAQRAEAEASLKVERSKIVAIAAVALILLIASGLCYRLYRRTRSAYLNLVEKNREWAQSTELHYQAKSENPENDATESEIEEMKRVNAFMLSNRSFIMPELTLDMLAEELNMPRHQLSNLINRVTKQGFSAYINELRIKEVIKRMDDKAFLNLTLEAIAFESGFSNYKTFRESFKKLTGVTPSTFRKDIIIEN